MNFIPNKKIMGILNVTPDSFFDGGKYSCAQKAIERAQQMIHEGADILDIGGCSTRPYSSPPTIEEEIERIQPVFKQLSRQSSTPLSIDTYRPEVAQVALDCGATFINDVCGFQSSEMRKLARQYQAKICIMHMPSLPKTMQKNPFYPNGVVTDVIRFFKKQAALCLDEGISTENIYLDPGIGFGKTLDDNFEILHNLDRFRGLNFPLLLGLSRKSFLYNTVKAPSSGCLAATIAMNAAIYNDVEIFRVHDVLEHHQMVAVLNKLNLSESSVVNYAGDSSHIHSDH